MTDDGLPTPEDFARDREEYVRANAMALLAERDAQIDRQRSRLTELGEIVRSLRIDNTRLRRVIRDQNKTKGASL